MDFFWRSITTNQLQMMCQWWENEQNSPNGKNMNNNSQWCMVMAMAKWHFFRLKMSLTMNLFGVHLWYFSGSCYRMNTFSRQRERERRKQSNANCTGINREKNHDTKFQKRSRDRWITEQLFFWFFNLYEFRLSIRYYVKRGSWPLFWHLKKW